MKFSEGEYIILDIISELGPGELCTCSQPHIKGLLGSLHYKGIVAPNGRHLYCHYPIGENEAEYHTKSSYYELTELGRQVIGL